MLTRIRVLRWKVQGVNTNSSVIPDDDVLLLRQFGHGGLQVKPHPGNITARRQQARVLLDMATFH